MESKGNYFYVRRPELKQDFTIIPNSIHKMGLTPQEFMILSYLFSNSESYRLTNYRIGKELKFGRRTVVNVMNKLKGLGIIKQTDRLFEINIDRINELSKIGVRKPIDQKAYRSESLQVTEPIDQKTPIDMGQEAPMIGVTEPIYRGQGTPIIGVTDTNNNINQEKIQKEPQHELPKPPEENFSLDSSKKENELLKELHLVMDHNPYFIDISKNIPNARESVKKLSRHSLSTIAYTVVDNKNNNKPNSNEWLYASYLIKYASITPNSKLWREFLNVCDNSELMRELNKNIDTE